MFKKSDHKGDKTPKTEVKEGAAKETVAAAHPAPASEKKSAPETATNKS